MERRVKMAEQWAVRILCAIALVFVGFAHQVPVLADDAVGPAGLAQYVLPDGSLPTLCVTDKSDNDRHDKARSQNCEACRISAAILIPPPADAAGEYLRFATAPQLPIRVEAFRRQLFPPNTGPRAPPADPIVA